MKMCQRPPQFRYTYVMDEVLYHTLVLAREKIAIIVDPVVRNRIVARDVVDRLRGEPGFDYLQAVTIGKAVTMIIRKVEDMARSRTQVRKFPDRSWTFDRSLTGLAATRLPQSPLRPVKVHLTT